MVKKYKRTDHSCDFDKSGINHHQTNSRVRADHQLSRRKAPFPSWPTVVMGSTLALGMVVATSAWADTPALPEKTPSLSVSAPTYLTEILPPYFPPALRILVPIKSFLSKHEILFIDQGVTDYQNLLDSMSREIEVVFLTPDQDGVSAITDHLQGRTNMRGIHIVSHGDPGRLFLGNMTLTTDELTQRQQDLAIWSQALGPNGDVLIYGCDVAKGLEGIRFVNRLSHTLTAGISASNDPTGSQALGGDWDFEYSRNVETETIFTGSVGKRYHALLTPGQIIAGDGSGGGGGGGLGGVYNTKYAPATTGGNGGDGGGYDDTLTGTDGNDIIFGDGSGGGGGGGGAGTSVYAGSIGGAGGTGGSGADAINGGNGDDILFGDGLDGFYGNTGTTGVGGSGGNGGFGNIAAAGTGGTGGTPVDYDAVVKYAAPIPIGTAGAAGFGGALGGLPAGAGATPSSYGLPGDNGSTNLVTQYDTGGTVHADTIAKVNSGYFNSRPGGNGNDVLNGGPGSDVLFGMGGTNTFVFDGATSRNDVDMIYGWNDGSANLIDLRYDGNTLDSDQIDGVVAAQITFGNDRTISLRTSENTITIGLKNINRDLTSADFVIGTGAHYKKYFPWPMFMPAIIGGSTL